MDSSGRSGGSNNSNGSGFLSNSSAGRSNQQPYGQQMQGSPSASDQQRMFQMQFMQMQRMQQLSPGSSQLQQMQQQNKERRDSTSSTNLGMVTSPIGSPSYNRSLIGSPMATPNSLALSGVGSGNSMRSVVSQQQNSKTGSTQMPPAPPLVSASSKNKNPTTSASAPVPTAPVSSSSNVASASHVNSSHNKRSNLHSAPPLPPEQSAELLKKCDWIDKTLWVSRQLFGGQSVNGFLRSTATVQRIKKQRARQNNKSKPASASGGDTEHAKEATDTNKKRGPETTDQEFEETLKKEIMNPRTAKKLKTEVEMGIKFCKMLHGTIRSILQDMDPKFPPVNPIAPESPRAKSHLQKSHVSSPIASKASSLAGNIESNKPKLSQGPTIPSLVPNADASNKTAIPASNPTVPSQPQNEETSSASAGDPSGSTLRKNRKKKLPPNTEPRIKLPEFDGAGKRICSKKEHVHRVFECIRYRALRKGDPVAARVSSRDLWILARVLKDYPASTLAPLDFVRLGESKREQLFKEQVLIKDVEDRQEDSSISVSRSLILPLPRSFSEAAEWGHRYKKGSRVYAMYPLTTSLYTATVVDATTYCREDDDIVVVRFDGDEPDHTGAIPLCHIPSRFVTMIPRGFPGEKAASKVPSSLSGSKVKKAGGFTAAPPAPVIPKTEPDTPAAENDPFNIAGNLDEIDLDEPLPGLEDFDDLDFGLLGD